MNIDPVRLGSTVRMPYGEHRGKLMHELPDGYLAWAQEIEWEAWVLRALQEEWKRRAPKPGSYPRCPRCGLTTDKLHEHKLSGPMCGRCYAKA